VVGSLDNVTWQALTVIVTLMGLVASGLLWRTRGAAFGLRMLAIALLPLAAYLTGTLRLLWEIGDAVVSWAAAIERQIHALAPREFLQCFDRIAGARVERGLGAKGSPGSSSRAAAKPQPESASESDDIEEILRRHGIS